MGSWAVIGVESLVAWPETDTEVEFRGHKLLVRPRDGDRLASVAFEFPDTWTLGEAQLLIRRYLSALSWVEQAAIKEVSATGGSHPFFLSGRGTVGSITRQFRHDYLPEAQGPKVELALAFHREGLSSDALPYRFLSFFKIINILFDKGPEQVDWINSSLGKIDDYRARPRLAELKASVPDVGKYLYQSGRCAVAHAYSSPLVDPENIEDNARLAADLPLVQALAEIAIESELKVKSRRTVWREHLYHLAGFRELFGTQVVSKLKQRIQPELEEIPPLPRLNLGVRDQPPLEAFKDLSPAVAAVEDGTVWIVCTNPPETAHVLLGLSLADELLIFEPDDHVAISGGSTVDALAARRDRLRLLRWLLGNGELEVSNAETGELLGRTDAYIGQNIDLGRSFDKIDRLISDLENQIASPED